MIRKLHDHESTVANEETVVGSLMASRNRATSDAVFSSVSQDDFIGDPALGKVFDVLLDMHERFVPMELELVRAGLQAAGIWDGFGGAARIGDLLNGRVSVTPIYYARLVRDYAAGHRMTLAMQSALSSFSDPTTDKRKTALELSAKLESMAVDSNIVFKTIGEIAADIVAGLDQPPRPLITTGLTKFDDEMGGFSSGELIVICARTSLGKSAFAAQIAEHTAKKELPVLFITLEMESRDIVYRILARRTGISVKQIRSLNLNDDQKDDIRAAADTMQNVPFRPHYMPGAKIADIRRTVKASASQFGIGLLVIDYLQIMGKSDNRMSTRDSIAEATRTLKQLAGELNCPVLALSQFNRETTKQAKPTLANLAESGAIENDADMVLAIHRTNPNDSDGELLVLKNRNGETVDLAGLRWYGQEMRFDFCNSWQPRS